MSRAIAHLKTLYKGMSARRVNSDLLNTIRVECYGCKLPIDQVALVSKNGVRSLLIQPFDNTNIHLIAKALSNNDLGFQIEKAKTSILLTVPPLTGDARKRLAKHAKDLAEQQKISLRNIRNNYRKQLKSSDLSKDEKKSLEKCIDTISKEFSQELQTIFENKQEVLLTE